jgi:hypothetical protein
MTLVLLLLMVILPVRLQELLLLLSRKARIWEACWNWVHGTDPSLV